PVFALASAICYLASRVAPVRGGTYFSLPPQRKVGKRKRLTPPAHVPIHGPPTSPRFTRQRPDPVPIANALNEYRTRFEHPYFGQRQRMAHAAQVANCV